LHLEVQCSEGTHITCERVDQHALECCVALCLLSISSCVGRVIRPIACRSHLLLLYGLLTADCFHCLAQVPLASINGPGFDAALSTLTTPADTLQGTSVYQLQE
jgi:hypothetical protein